MRKRSFLWLSIVVTLMLTYTGIAQDKSQNPGKRQLLQDQNIPSVANKWTKAGQEQFMQRLDSLLQHVGESVGQRYELDETTVNELQRHVHELVKTQLNQEVEAMAKAINNPADPSQQSKEMVWSSVISTPTGQKIVAMNGEGGIEMLELLLSQPDCKAAFAKHLNEAQFQDYLDFTQTRRQRAQRAINRQLTADLDQQLILTADQRQKIEQLLGVEVGAEWRLTWGNMLGKEMLLKETNSQDSVNMLHRLKVPIDGILSKSHSEIWKLLCFSNL